jgi:hypothetical protein
MVLIARRAISSNNQTTKKTPTMNSTNARQPNVGSPCHKSAYAKNRSIPIGLLLLHAGSAFKSSGYAILIGLSDRAARLRVE